MMAGIGVRGTPGCTAEACAFRDSHEVFVDAGAAVVGVSSDSVTSHDKFSGRHDHPFVLLSDPGGKVRRRYGCRIRWACCRAG
jgi:thioredoxin-dependent peroxiredoxin